jgi:hypothetical protein
VKGFGSRERGSLSLRLRRLKEFSDGQEEHCVRAAVVMPAPLFICP